jgi:hypothetical protein
MHSGLARRQKEKGMIRTSEQSVRTTALNAADTVDNFAQLTQNVEKSEKTVCLSRTEKKRE